MALRFDDDEPAWPDELADEALSRGRRQSDTPGRETWPLPAWPATETRFIVCRTDRFFPASWLRTHKVWPSVARVESAYGDRNLVCSCLLADAYAESNADGA